MPTLLLRASIECLSFIDENHKNNSKYKDVIERHLEMRGFGGYKGRVEQGWSLLRVPAGQLGLAVRRMRMGWADMASSLPGLRWLPQPPGSLVRLRALAAQELEEMKLWVAAVGLTGSSQDLAPCALSAAVQNQVFAGTGRNSRLSLGLVVLWFLFLNCK